MICIEGGRAPLGMQVLYVISQQNTDLGFGIKPRLLQQRRVGRLWSADDVHRSHLRRPHERQLQLGGPSSSSLDEAGEIDLRNGVPGYWRVIRGAGARRKSPSPASLSQRGAVRS